MAKKTLEKLGVGGLTVITGGMVAYAEAGGQTVHGKSSISLERQVRIGAGGMVVIGVLLGWIVHPAFLILSGFVGAGLIFAGIINWCGMGILLSKMPWNRFDAVEGASAAGGTCAASLPGTCAATPPPKKEDDQGR